MLQKIGDKLQGQRWVAYVVMGALGLVFAVAGAYGIVDLSMGSGNYAAKVNGQEVSAEEVNRAWQEEQPQYLRMFGGEMNAEQRSRLQNQLLDGYIRNAVVLQHSQKLGFRVSKSQLQKAYETEPAFQVDGKFSPQAAYARLAAAGITPAAYDADRTRSLAMNQLAGAIAGTDFLTPAELSRYLALEDEQRELRFVLLPAQKFGAGAAIEPAAIEAHYKEHGAQYTTAESVRLAYAELSQADVAAQVKISDAQLREEFEKARDRYNEPERRQARHILLSVDSARDDAKVKAQAEDLAKQIAAGKDFAELARQFSKDPGSAAKGGDLGWADRGTYVAPFADALFALSTTGQVTAPVKTEFGYHLIKLEGVQPAHSRSFDEVRSELTAELSRKRAGDRYGEIQEQIQERVERGGGNLEQLVKDFNLKAGEVPQFLRGSGGLPLGSDAALNEAVFSDNVLNQKRVGGPLPLGEDRLVVFQVLDHKPPALRPLDEVRAQIVETLTRERGSAAARKAAEDAVAQMAAGASFDKVASALKVKAEPARFIARGDAEVPSQVRNAAFALPRPANDKPLRRAVPIDEGGAAVFEVTAVRMPPPDAGAAQLAALRTQRETQRRSLDDVDAYVAELVRDAKVKKNLKVFE